MRISDWSSDVCSSDLFDHVRFERSSSSFLFSGRYAIENVPRECAWTSVAGGNNLESFLELDASIFARFAVFSAMLSDRENSRVTRLDGDAISARSADDRLPEIVIVLEDRKSTRLNS